MKPVSCLIVALSVVVPCVTIAAAETITVPNPSFEEGEGDRPTGWTTSDASCKWLTEGASDGRRAITVTGTGENDSAWHSADIPFQPSAVYRLSFKARSMDASGGTPTTGPTFCNRDLGGIPAEWKSYENIFATPREIGTGAGRLRFGQWHVKGTIAYDAISLWPAVPVHLRRDDVVLGEGEAIEGQQYVFEAPFHAQTNHSRPLVSYTCGFNSNRWTLNSGHEVVYRHQINSRRHSAASVTIGVTYRTAGTLTVEASSDGRAWQEIAVIEKLATETLPIPKDLLPADAVWIRLRASRDANLQASSYGFASTLTGTPMNLQGATRYLSVEKTDPRLDVTVEDLGEVLPGGANTLVLHVKNTTEKAVPVHPTVSASCDNGRQTITTRQRTLVAGEQRIRVWYDVPDSGLCSLEIELGRESLSRSQPFLRPKKGRVNRSMTGAHRNFNV